MNRTNPKRKAVIIGISDYGGIQPTLSASENEAQEWKDLLVRRYHFPAEGVRLLCSPRATKLAIEERLEWLLADASDKDQLVFFFCGHGVRLRRRHPNGTVHDNMDEAIVAFPEHSQDIEQYSLYDDDLVRIVQLSQLPYGVDLTFVLDCCFSGGFGVREQDQRRVFVPRDIAHRAEAGSDGYACRFGTCRALPTRYQEPVIVASVPTLDESPTEEFEGRRRTVFGYHAIKSLRADADQSYSDLGKAVSQAMLERGIQNAPVINGNKARSNHRFLT